MCRIRWQIIPRRTMHRAGSLWSSNRFAAATAYFSLCLFFLSTPLSWSFREPCIHTNKMPSTIKKQKTMVLMMMDTTKATTPYLFHAISTWRAISERCSPHDWNCNIFLVCFGICFSVSFFPPSRCVCVCFGGWFSSDQRRLSATHKIVTNVNRTPKHQNQQK